MPKATVSLEPERRELKSCPEGFVVLKRMSYGQIVERRAMTKLGFNTDGKSRDFHGELAMANEQVTAYEFAHCIIDHNLEDDNGQKLNLSTPVGLAQLDPRVGQEVEQYIGEMNNFEEETDQGN